MKRTPMEICHYILQLHNLHLQWRFKTLIQACCNADLIAFKLIVNATSIKDMPCKPQLLNLLSMCKSNHDFANKLFEVNVPCAQFELNVHEQYQILQATTEQDWLQMQNDMQSATFKQSTEMTVNTEDLHATEEVELHEESERGIVITSVDTVAESSKKPSKRSKRRRTK